MRRAPHELIKSSAIFKVFIQTGCEASSEVVNITQGSAENGRVHTASYLSSVIFRERPLRYYVFTF